MIKTENCQVNRLWAEWVFDGTSYPAHVTLFETAVARIGDRAPLRVGLIYWFPTARKRVRFQQIGFQGQLLADEATYQRQGDRNVLTLVKEFAQPGMTSEA